MKKKLGSLFLAIFMMACTTVPAFARASYNLDDYYVDLYAAGDGEMLAAVVVNGVSVQDKIGVTRIDIEKKVNGTWIYDRSLDAVDHPEFYVYNARTFLEDIPFEGVPGTSYRVTVLVYARQGSNSDTGYVSSMPVICK